LPPCWPVGTSSNAANIAKLLHSASTAVRAADKSTKIMVHLDNGGSLTTQENWYKNILNAGGGFVTSDFDIQGISYYPFYGTQATIAQLTKTANGLVAIYGKDVIAAETNWPTSCKNGPALSEPSIPVSVAGQVQWVSELMKALDAVNGGHGKGIFYWEPAWIGNDALGSGCGNNLLFDDTGKALQSVNMYL